MLLCNDTSVTPGTCCTHWQYVKQGSFCRTYPSCHHSWHHGLKPRKNPNLLIPISQNLQRKVSGQGKATLLLCQPLSKLLGQSHSSITLPGLRPCVSCGWQMQGTRAGEPSLSAATYHPSRKTAPSACTIHKIISCMESAVSLQAGLPIRGGGRMSWGKNWCQGK